MRTGDTHDDQGHDGQVHGKEVHGEEVHGEEFHDELVHWRSVFVFVVKQEGVFKKGSGSHFKIGSDRRPNESSV